MKRKVDSEETWYVVWRGNKPVALFPTREIAMGWIREAPHRFSDRIGSRRIAFKGISGTRNRVLC